MKQFSLIKGREVMTVLSPGESYQNNDFLDFSWTDLTVRLVHSKFEREGHDSSAIRQYDFHQGFSLPQIYF
jgi:hypothetical protein